MRMNCLPSTPRTVKKSKNSKHVASQTKFAKSEGVSKMLKLLRFNKLLMRPLHRRDQFWGRRFVPLKVHIPNKYPNFGQTTNRSSLVSGQAGRRRKQRL